MKKYLEMLGRTLCGRAKSNKPILPAAVAVEQKVVPSLPPEGAKQLMWESVDTKDTCLKPEAPEKIIKEKSVEPRSTFVSTFDQLFKTADRPPYKSINKVTVVGAGEVGQATAFALLTKSISNDVSMVDFSEQKLKGELMDLQSGLKFLPNARFRASKDYAISADSKICVLTPCTDTVSGNKSFDCVRCNAGVIRTVVPQLLQHSSNCILLVATEPVDVLSYWAWRISDLPKSRVLGSGTNLPTATFRYLLSDRLGLAPSACHGFIIGENGWSSVPVWSGVTAGGVLLIELNPDIGTDADPEGWQNVYRQVLLSGQDVREIKGHNSWATALSIADICAGILNDSNCVRPLSTYTKGEHDIDDDVFMSLPCVLGGTGISDIVRLPLTSQELELLRKSAQIIAENIGTTKISQ